MQGKEFEDTGCVETNLASLLEFLKSNNKIKGMELCCVDDQNSILLNFKNDLGITTRQIDISCNDADRSYLLHQINGLIENGPSDEGL